MTSTFGRLPSFNQRMARCIQEGVDQINGKITIHNILTISMIALAVFGVLFRNPFILLGSFVVLVGRMYNTGAIAAKVKKYEKLIPGLIVQLEKPPFLWVFKRPVHIPSEITKLANE